ncbi:Mitochondrial 5'-3' exonuclease and sliding exonuclease [Desmophyllum pertusum]|uniref:Mitochondrial 5'-3' exonuclease and sliding exonuclease n=1 Tax=Desmophyllum pertusum TaxID=174260 RepID=A0A9W9Z904_9CNID|nr:Mitochondrial 5'-3' exonuclease and sliding exonuclease [Desmophyllum pertusum]
MAQFLEDTDPICGSQDSVEVEIVSDDEFKMLDEAIQNAMKEEIKTTGIKEDASHSSTKEFLTPLDKFRGSKGYLSVSDLTSQFWCEQQMEYNFLAPEPKPESEQMQLGKNIHLARELELYDLVEINIESKEDKWATIFLNCLLKMASLEAQQTVRELPVFGQPSVNMGVFVYGIIDELRFKRDGAAGTFRAENSGKEQYSAF